MPPAGFPPTHRLFPDTAAGPPAPPPVLQLAAPQPLLQRLAALPPTGGHAGQQHAAPPAGAADPLATAEALISALLQGRSDAPPAGELQALLATLASDPGHLAPAPPPGSGGA